MSSLLGIPLLRIAIILAMSLILKYTLSQKLRDMLIPWCFFGMLAHGCVVPFISGFVHFVVLCCYFIEMAILLDGCNLKYFQRNPPMTAFLVFWGYLMLSSLWSDDVYVAFTWWVGCLFELVLAGYFLGIWILRTPDGLRRLFTPLALAGILILYNYFKYGFTETIDASGRGVLDEDMLDEGLGTNVNQIGLMLAPVVSSLVVMLMVRVSRNKWQQIVKLAAIITLLLTAYLLLRTGSRNACLVFFPCVYFIYKSIRFTGKKAQTLFLFGIVGVGLAILVKVFMMSESNMLRAFTFWESGNSFDVYQASSGRWYEFEMYLSKMSGIDWLIGAGTEVYKVETGQKVVGGCLSTYVTLLRFSGLIGLMLLGIYFLVMLHSARRSGFIGQVALLFFMTWVVTGIAEGKGVRRGFSLRLLQGVSLALCSKIPFQRRDEMWVDSPTMSHMGYYR